MEEKTIGSPLSRICYQDSTFMLEALLPFVPAGLKLPLAIMIKWNEFQRMLSVFQNRELLSMYGLAEQEFTMQGLANQLAGCPNPKLTESIGQIGQMMQMMQMMQTMQTMQNMESDISAPTGTGKSSSLDTAISDILRQYDDANTYSPESDSIETAISTDIHIPEDTLIDTNPPDNISTDPLEDFNIDQFVKEIFS